MKGLDIILKNEAVKVLAINLTVAIVLPIAVNLLIPVVRPIARDALKTGIRGYEKARKSVSEFGEFVDDLVCEVQEELEEAKVATTDFIKPKQNTLGSRDKS